MRFTVKLFGLFILLLSGSNSAFSKLPAKAGADSIFSISEKVEKESTQIIDEPVLEKSTNSDQNEYQTFSTSNQFDSDTRSKLDDSATERVNKSTFFKIGGILTVLGLIFGFMFGRTAFLISLAGVVFLAIGHFLI
ncbi:MAG: hypothetical protein ABI390_07060 [Daejeonella sp.]